MLSKEERLRYGQMLRQQMREKEARKKEEEMAKRGSYKQPVTQITNGHQPKKLDRGDVGVQMEANSKSVYTPKLQSNSQIINQKQQLQMKLQGQIYDPFGRAGGGAPNKPVQGKQRLNAQELYLYSNANIDDPRTRRTIDVNTQSLVDIPSHLDKDHNGRSALEMKETPYSHPSFEMQGNQQRMFQGPKAVYSSQQPQYPIYNNQPMQPMQPYQQYQPTPFQQMRKQSQQQLLAKNDLSQYYPQMHPQMLQEMYPEVHAQPYPQHYIEQRSQEYPQRPEVQVSSVYYPPQTIQHRLVAERPGSEMPSVNSPNSPNIPQKGLQHEQLQSLYKHGGRNLLQLENLTLDQQLIKQKNKQQMQRYLLQQMKEAQKKKQQAIEQRKREELEEERKNKEFLMKQHQKLIEEEKKKNQDKQKVIDENVKNMQRRKELQQEAKDKIENQRKLREEQMIQEKQHKVHQDRPLKVQSEGPQEIQQRQKKMRRVQQMAPVSQASQQTYAERAGQSDSVSMPPRSRNTRRRRVETSSAADYSQNETDSIASRDYVARQYAMSKQKIEPVYKGSGNIKKLQQFTHQIKRMRDEINNQGELFQQELAKVKREAERAQDDKLRAERQIQKLKNQLITKNMEDQKKLFEALKKATTSEEDRRPPQRQIASPKQPRKQVNEQRRNQENRYLQDDRKRNYPQQIALVPLKPTGNEKYVTQTYEYKANDSKEYKQHKDSRDYKQNDSELQLGGLMSLDGESKKIPVELPKNMALQISKISEYAQEPSYFTKPKQNVRSANYAPATSIVEEDYEPQRKNKSRQGQDQLDRFVATNGKGKKEEGTMNADIIDEIEQLLKKKEVKQQQYQQHQQPVKRNISSRQGLPYEGPGLTTVNSGVSTLDINQINNRNDKRLRELRNLGVETINTNDDEVSQIDRLLKRYH